MLEKLIELEEKLKHHSHDQTAIEIVQDFAKSLGKTRDRQVLFGSDGVLLREPPIIYQEVSGINSTETAILIRLQTGIRVLAIHASPPHTQACFRNPSRTIA